MTTEEKLTTIAENEEKVFEAGRKSQYDEFWDVYQQNGKRANYQFAFAGIGWTNEKFKPKYDIIITSVAYGLFWGTGLTGDLVEILNSLNIRLDTSKSAQYQYMFSAAKFTRVGVIDLSGSASLSGTFSGCDKLKTIDKLILKNEGTNTFSSTFELCRELKNITIEGVIGSSIDFQYSPLSSVSIVSIIEHLSDNSGGMTLILNKTAVDSMDYSLISYKDWESLIATKPNWNISLL